MHPRPEFSRQVLAALSSNSYSPIMITLKQP